MLPKEGDKLELVFKIESLQRVCIPDEIYMVETCTRDQAAADYRALAEITGMHEHSGLLHQDIS